MANLIEEKLKDIQSIVNEWLKFAEAKSTTLIAGNGVLIFGASRSIISFELEGFLFYYFIFLIILCCFSSILCLLSLVPALSMPWEDKPSNIDENDNLQYFAHIAKYTPSTYLSKLISSLSITSPVINNYQKNQADQIITNSVIAVRKYNLFKKAIWLTLTAVTTPLFALVIYYIKE
ncbi:MAG: hypothetical protein ACI9YE_001818 [Psychroserpens sp.]|jgi:hypothetical protein